MTWMFLNFFFKDDSLFNIFDEKYKKNLLQIKKINKNNIKNLFKTKIIKIKKNKIQNNKKYYKDFPLLGILKFTIEI